MRWLLILVGVVLAFAQSGGTEPKANAEDYDVHAKAGPISIGAEFMIHSFSGDGQTYIANDFLIVEVALFPPPLIDVKRPQDHKFGNVDVKSGEFALRVNGKMQTIAPVPPSTVVQTLRNPEWQNRPQMEASGGMGNTGVILGRPVPSTIPNGQPNPQPRRVPGAPPQDDPGGYQREVRISAPDLLVKTALPEGSFTHPVSGYLYFPYRGKISSIKQLYLLYDGVELKLR